jgi:alpha-galactosidase
VLPLPPPPPRRCARSSAVVDAIGSDGYVVGCGAPLACSVGLLDGCRIASDTEMSWHPHPHAAAAGASICPPSTALALRSVLHRVGEQQHGRPALN